MLKRVISLILSLAMVLSLMPMQISASAEELPAEDTAVGETVESTEEVTPTEETFPEVTIVTGEVQMEYADTYDSSITASGTCGENLTWALTSDGTLTVSGTGAMYDYSTANVSPWSEKVEDITAVVLEYGVTSVGDYAFHGCRDLLQITLSPFLESIGSYAFYSCNALAEITIPASVVSVKRRAFAWCTGLTEVTFADDAPQIASNAFHYVTATAYYPAGNESWTEAMLQNYSGTITWKPYSVCEHTVVIDEALEATCTSDGKTEGKHCSACGEVMVEQEVIPGGHTVENGICTRCEVYGICGENLTWTLTEDGILIISGTGVMYNYATFNFDTPWYPYVESVKTIVIENGVTSIGDCAFSDCKKLTAVEIPDSVTDIGEIAFRYCTSLTSVEIPDSVTSIGNAAFVFCYSLTSVTIPASVIRMDENVFPVCESLTKIVVDENNPNYSSDQYGVLFNKDQTALISCPAGKTGDYVIPDSVTSIGNTAFYNCGGLTSVKIPDSVTSIGDSAFERCFGLTNLVIPDSVVDVGNSAFWGCTSLTEITFEGDAPEFGEAVFDYVTATAYYPAGNATWTEEVRKNYGGIITWDSYVTGVAAVNGVGYDTLTEALAAAKSGDTVQMLQDTVESEIRVSEGITLDLNGYVLQVDYLFAVNGSHIVDNSENNTGLLKVAADKLVVSKTNAQLPVGTGEGFIFIDLLSFQEVYTTNALGQKQYIFSPAFETVAHQHLAQGAANSHLRITIRMTWKTESGSASRNCVFNDQTVKNVMESFDGSWYAQAFYATVTNGEYADFEMQVTLISDTGVEYVPEITVDDVPVPTDPLQIVKDAYALAGGEELPYNPVTLTGTIAKVTSPWNDQYGNITVTMYINEDTNKEYPIECYRMVSTGGELDEAIKTLAVNNTIKVTGTLMKYQSSTGATKVEFNCPELMDVITLDEMIVDAAYALTPGETLGTRTLFGKIISVDMAYNAEMDNITVTMQVGDQTDKLIQCFRLKGYGAGDLKVGDEIMVTGELLNDNGTVRFSDGCTFIPAVLPEDDEIIINYAYSLASGQSMPSACSLTGQVVSIDSAYRETYDDITLTMEVAGKNVQCYRMKGDDAANVGIGDEIAVTGTLRNHNGKVEFGEGCTFVTVKKYEPEEDSGESGTEGIYMTSAPKNGDKVLIVAPAYNKALSSKATGNYNAGVSVTASGSTLTGYGNTEIWTVTVNDDGSYSFANGDQNIGMQASYTSMKMGAVNDDWSLTALGNGLFNIKNVVRGTYMEWYSKYLNWSTYGASNAATDYQFQLAFYLVEAAEEPSPYMTSAPENGDKVVIVAPAYNKALSVAKTGNYNVGVNVMSSGNTLSGYADTEVFTVIVNEDGSYSFENSGQNLGMAVSYNSMNMGEVNDKWTVTSLTTERLFNIKNNGRGNFMQWHSQYMDWSTYNSSSAATDDQYQLAFYLVEGAAEPELKVSTIAEALKAATGTELKITGYVNMVDGSKVYVQDATGAVCIEMASSAAQKGDTFTFTGTKAAGSVITGTAAEKADSALAQFVTTLPLYDIATEVHLYHYINITSELTVIGEEGDYIIVSDIQENWAKIFDPICAEPAKLVKGAVITFKGVMMEDHDGYMSFRNADASDITIVKEAEGGSSHLVTKVYTIADYDLPTTASTFDHTMDEFLSISVAMGVKKDDLLRVYAGRPLVFSSAKEISNFVLKAKTSTTTDTSFSVEISNDGSTWTRVIASVAVAAVEGDVTVTLNTPAKYIRINPVKQIRVRSITVSYI